MDGSRADPFALQIAAELAASTDGNKTHENAHASANDNEDKRRGGNSTLRGGGQRWQAQQPLEDTQRLATHGSPPSPARGRDATSVSAALHDAVLRWGAPTERRRYGVGAAGGGIPLSSRGGVYGAGEASPLSSSASPLCVRYSWTLVEAQHRRSVHPPPTTPGDQQDAGLDGGNGATPAWSIGQRWVRHDSMLCDTALLAALQKGVSTDSPPHQQNAQHALYAKGLRMCAEGVRRGVSLPAFVAAVGSLESSAAAGHGLSFFTFTREEYEALTPPSPLPSRVSAADGGLACAASPFTYASSCLLMQLWQRYGNPVVVVDRWAAMVAQRHSPSLHAPQEGRFSLSVSAAPHTSILHQSATRSGEPSLLSLVPAWVPTVEQACAEYARVTAGVLQLRRQRLLDALAAQHAQQQQQKKHVQRQNHDVDDNSRGSTCLRDPRPSSRHQAAAENVPTILHTPLVTAFDKYALLHCAKNSANRDSREGDDTHDGNHVQSTQQQEPLLANELASQPSPPSSGPRVTASPTPQPSVSAATTILQEQAHAITPQQQLVELTTPSPWYLYDAEVSRRASVAALLSSEQATNVPYQRCATRYLRLVVSAAQAMQRASTLYDDRDRDAPDAAAEDGQPDEGSSTSHHAAEVADHIATTPSSVQGRSAAPPRAAFVAALRSLPNIDPAAWRSAEAAVRKAAAEVLQSAAAAGLKPRPPHRGARQRMDDAVTPQRKRGRPRSCVPAGVVRRARQAPKLEKHSSAVVKYEEKEEEEEQEEANEEEEGDGALPDGSREASLESSSSSSSTNGRREDGTKSRSGSAKSDSDHSSSSSSDNGDEGEVEDDDDDGNGGEEVERDGSASPDRQNNEEEEENAEEAVTDKRTTTTPTERRNRKAKQKPLSKNSRPAKASRVRRSSPSSPVSAAAQVPPLHSDTTYREMTDYVHDVIPFLCARLSTATQAGWLLPPPPPLPRTLTNTLSDEEVATMQIHARRPSLLPAVVAHDRAEKSAVVGESTQAVQTTTASPPSFSFHEEEDPLRPILTDAVYHDLRAINAAAVCNRVVSHTSEAVLLSLPAAVPRLHREVEQELERYLYDDTSAMMEMTPTAQHLLAAIRVVYTQNTCLQRYLTRLEHVAENLEKVVQECKEAMASGTETL